MNFLMAVFAWCAIIAVISLGSVIAESDLKVSELLGYWFESCSSSDESPGHHRFYLSEDTYGKDHTVL